MNGLGKPRSKLGAFLDEYGISQTELVMSTGVSKSSISRLCKRDDEDLLLSSATKILNHLRRYDNSITFDSFWNN